MGDMIVRGVDEETLSRLREEAERQGLDPSDFAANVLRTALARPRRDRAAVSRAILASQRGFSPVSSVEILRQLRDEA